MPDSLTSVYHALWIIGLALILASFSYCHWLAHQQQSNLKQILNRYTFQFPLRLGLILICVSLIGLAQSWWEQLIWFLFVVIFTRQARQLWQVERR